MEAAAIDHFEGVVAYVPFVGSTLGLELSPNDDMHLVIFKDGAVNHWHTHESRQILLFTDGRGIVEVKDGEHVEVGAGEVVVVPKRVVHRHGASAGNDCTHLAIQQGAADWLE